MNTDKNRKVTPLEAAVRIVRMLQSPKGQAMLARHKEEREQKSNSWLPRDNRDVWS